MEFKGTKGEWTLPHLADDNTTCDCGFVLNDGYCGAIATVHYSVDRDLENGDNPPLDEAKWNAKLIANAPELLKVCQNIMECYEEKGQLLSFNVDEVRKVLEKTLL
jgi:hypothetical protein